MMLIDYYANHNRLSHFHPGEKAVFAFSQLGLVLFAKDICLCAFVFFLMSFSTVFFAGIPFSRYGRMLMLPLVFLLLSMLPMLVSIAPKGMGIESAVYSFSWNRWSVYLSPDSLLQAMNLWAAAYAGVSCMYFFILTTPYDGVCWLLKKLKAPDLFIELTALTYRFIFVFIEKAQSTYQAQKSRAGYAHIRSCFYSFSALLVNLLVQTLRESKQLQMTLDARCGEGFNTRPTGRYTMNPAAWGVIISSVGCSLLIYLRG
ncbi:cobalt ECF transporter T component CbiQ [Bacillus xiapuensis]|uniref:cobalt ECF transporter T component CbiQ n=1 Tax=Bacillus xiapuensis TaxID=2014075 RepID=UPI000C23047C|nr:cobalt ECF transporter T component CbiQ [Bacillus xiapuensis]